MQNPFHLQGRFLQSEESSLTFVSEQFQIYQVRADYTKIIKICFLHFGVEDPYNPAQFDDTVLAEQGHTKKEAEYFSTKAN